MSITNLISDVGEEYISKYDPAHEDNIKAKQAKIDAETDAEKKAVMQKELALLVPTKWMISGLDGFLSLRLQEQFDKGLSLDQIIDETKFTDAELARKRTSQAISTMLKLVPFYYNAIKFGLKGIQGSPWTQDGKPVELKLQDITENVGGVNLKYKAVPDEFIQTLPKELLSELGMAILDKCRLSDEDKKK